MGPNPHAGPPGALHPDGVPPASRQRLTLSAGRSICAFAVAGILLTGALLARHVLRPEPRVLRGWSIAPSTPRVHAAAVDVFQRGTGRIAVGEQVSTVEGDPVYRYLLVDGRRVRLVVDSRDDRWSAARRVHEVALDSISLGYLAAEATMRTLPRFVSVHLDSAGTARHPLSLLCWIDTRVVCGFDP